MTTRDTAIAVVTAVSAGLLAATLAVILAFAAPRAAADPAPGCAEWTDGCRVCQRTAQGPACSTPGIACQVGPTRCLRRS
ncbi:MAG TPA: hypothetical protein VIL65_00370 [Beijerinckiaceae bacterium]|jgi:hypothetical protein